MAQVRTLAIEPVRYQRANPRAGDTAPDTVNRTVVGHPEGNRGRPSFTSELRAAPFQADRRAPRPEM
jgi:hypothetical protein